MKIDKNNLNIVHLSDLTFTGYIGDVFAVNVVDDERIYIKYSGVYRCYSVKRKEFIFSFLANLLQLLYQIDLSLLKFDVDDSGGLIIYNGFRFLYFNLYTEEYVVLDLTQKL